MMCFFCILVVYFCKEIYQQLEFRFFFEMKVSRDMKGKVVDWYIILLFFNIIYLDLEGVEVL